jgi:hypothetical protein
MIAKTASFFPLSQWPEQAAEKLEPLKRARLVGHGFYSLRKLMFCIRARPQSRHKWLKIHSALAAEGSGLRALFDPFPQPVKPLSGTLRKARKSTCRRGKLEE